ncbi:MAG: type II toxin-antitoxin system RelE/ParE family toxin [Desulfobacteraceae bacterium]|jgi:mRNA-degrading endonuclease RelE of RelBE toxin-antitoxin system
MVRVDYEPRFKLTIQKIKDVSFEKKVKKQIIKIIENPKIGKPMRYSRRGTRELYVKPFRLSYLYIENEDRIVLLDLYHKKKQ